MFSPDRKDDAADISTKLNLTNEYLTSPTTSLGGPSYLLTLGDAPLGATYFAASMSSVPIIGTALDDILTSEGSGDDSLIGLNGHDTLRSLGGVDFLFGSAGDDLLDAGDFADWLYGDAGNDTLHGGNGFDIFRAHRRCFKRRLRSSAAHLARPSCLRICPRNGHDSPWR